MKSIDRHGHRLPVALLVCSFVLSAYACEAPYRASFTTLTDGMQVTHAGTIQLAIITTPATTLDHVTYYKQQDDGHFEMVAELTDSLAYDWQVDASQNGLVRWVALVSSPTTGVGVTPIVTVAVDIQAATGPTHPGMFINQQEIDAVRAKISAGQEPWTSAYNQMISAANAALSKSPESVVDNGGGCVDTNPHMFATDGTKDGSWGSRVDYQKAERMSQAITALGLGYAFSGEPEYADKALQLLDHWMVDPATYMAPYNGNFSPHTCGWGHQWSIEVMITIPGMLYGADLIWNYAGWDPQTKAGVAQWAWDIAADTMSQDGGYYNNGENWRYLLEASAGALLGDQTILNHAFGRYRNAFAGVLDSSHTAGQMNADGSLKYEIARSVSLDYTNFALLPMIGTAEIARHNGTDLYTYKLSDGRGVEKGLDYAAPATANPAVWAHPQSPAYRGEQAGLYELAYLWKQKPVYLSAVTTWGRPISGWAKTWILGFPTLTHSYGAYPWQVH